MKRIKIFDKKLVGNYKDTYSYLIKWIEENPHEFLACSQHQITEKIYVSQSSLSRFTKFLGFESYRELQIYVARKVEQFLPNETYKIDEIKDAKDCILKVFQQYQNISKAGFNTIETIQIEKLVNNLIKYKKLIIFGIGTSGIIGCYLAKQLTRIGIISVCMNSIHDFKDAYNESNKDDVFYIIISKSFKNHEVKEAAEILDKSNFNFQILTRNENVSYANCTSPIIYDYIPAQKNFNYDIVSKLSLFMLVDIIYIYAKTLIDNKNE